MRRKLFNLVAALSLLLCVAAGVLWVRSYWVKDSILHEGIRLRVIQSNRGSLTFFSVARDDLTISPLSPVPPVRPSGQFRYARDEPVEFSARVPWNDFEQKIDFDFAGFRWYVSEGGLGRVPVSFGTGGRLVLSFPSRMAMVPFWFLVPLSGALPALFLIKRKRRMPGTCKTCGYDLRATPERCPECGAIHEVEMTPAKRPG